MFPTEAHPPLFANLTFPNPGLYRSLLPPWPLTIHSPPHSQRQVLKTRIRTTHSPALKSPWLPSPLDRNPRVAQPNPLLRSHRLCSPTCLLCSSHQDLPAVPQQHQVYSCLRIVALTVHSAWYALPLAGTGSPERASHLSTATQLGSGRAGTRTSQTYNCPALGHTPHLPFPSCHVVSRDPPGRRQSWGRGI